MRTRMIFMPRTWLVVVIVMLVLVGSLTLIGVSVSGNAANHGVSRRTVNTDLTSIDSNLNVSSRGASTCDALDLQLLPLHVVFHRRRPADSTKHGFFHWCSRLRTRKGEDMSQHLFDNTAPASRDE
jgi:hypothetical protein